MYFTITIPNLAKHVKKGVQTAINFYAKQKEATWLIPAGWIVAKEQFVLNDYRMQDVGGNNSCPPNSLNHLLLNLFEF